MENFHQRLDPIIITTDDKPCQCHLYSYYPKNAATTAARSCHHGSFPLKMYMLSYQIWVVEPDPAELLQVEPPGVTQLLPLI